MNKINFVNYPDIKQYRNIVKEIKYLSAKYANPLSTLKVTASEKIHGKNMAFCINENEYWFQSRNSILTSDPKLVYEDGFINIDESDFTTKDVMPIVAQKAKEYFFMIEKECDKL